MSTTMVSDLTILVPSFISICIILALIKFIHKLWWTPIRLQRSMALQGIKGPPYRFVQGSTKEISSMLKEAMTKPMMGLSHDVFSRLHPHIHCWTKLYGNMYLQWYGHKPQVVITESNLIREILNHKDLAFAKMDQPYCTKKILGDGLASSQGEKWTRMRKLANYVFHSESLRNMIPAMIESVENMLTGWKNHQGKEIDVYEEFTLLSSEMISRTAFGSSYLEGKAIFEMLSKLVFLASRNSYKLRFPGISKAFKTDDEIESEKLQKGMRKSIIEIVKRKEEKVLLRSNEEKNGFGRDFLGVLLKARHQDPDGKQKISMDDLVDECKTFYFAGKDSTSSLLTWTVFLLAVHTDWQERARKEILDVFAKENPTPYGITKLKTMSLIIYESLRLYPPAVSVAVRKVEREVRLGKFNIPPNTTLYMSILAIHHDPQIWGQDVHIFKPERFSQGFAKATKNNNYAAFLPFGIGPRNCVGNDFAMLEAKIVLSMILQRYTFTLSPAYVHSPIQFLTTRPQYGLQVILQPL